MLSLVAVLLCSAAAADGPQAATPVTPLEEANLRQLLTIRRVYVDRLSGGETAAQMRDILINAIQDAKLFVVTESQDRADAMLRGSAEDLVFNETHNSTGSINARANVGVGKSSSSSRSAYGGASIGQNESEHSTERRHEAIAALRLVNKDGDVIWSVTQESLGGKFRGASADVAARITAKLKEDFEKARKLAAPAQR
jgi:hypothetical protein